MHSARATIQLCVVYLLPCTTCKCMQSAAVQHSRIISSSTSHMAQSEPLSSVPHQPQSFAFPRRAFGKTAVVYRSFQRGWFSTWKWLDYNETADSVTCHLCCKAVREGKMQMKSADSAFVSLSLLCDKFALHF